MPITPEAALALALLFGGPAEAPKAPAEPNPPAWKAPTQPGGHALRVLVNGWGGSATPVACENGKTLVVTNAHVFPRRFRNLPAQVVLPDGRRLAARWLEGSESLGDGSSVRTEEPDLAALVVDGELTPVPLAAKAPAAGEVVRHWGVGPTQIGQAPVGREGRVADVYGWSHNFLMTTCPSQSGDSGSGVLNAKGELVGVTRGRDSSERYHRAQTLDTVRTFLARPAIAAAFPKLAVASAACPCPLTGDDCVGGKCAAGCDCGKAAAPKAVPPADTRLWQVNGQGTYTTDQIRAMGLAVPGEAAACPTGTCPLQQPRAAPTYYYTLPGSCPNGKCNAVR